MRGLDENLKSSLLIYTCFVTLDESKIRTP
jgi:hypothetical protein